MSREIKFRLYSKPAKKYIDYITIGFSKTGELRSYSTENGVGPVLEDSYIVEQYTGLKDKNGKMIFEGDIIRVLNDEFQIPSEDKTDCAEVIYSEFETGFVYKTWYGHVYVGRHDTSVEVIGNIHENPELLGGEK